VGRENILESSNGQTSIIPDDQREWYRYRLFAELLQALLKEAQAEHIPEYHRRQLSGMSK
jgi:ATP/maltotriose-dependent transcriptional regulator MalT